MQCGPVRHRVDARKQAAERPFAHTVIVRPTGFHPSTATEADARSEFHEKYDELIADTSRNELICSDVVQAVREGHSPVVLTERTEHLEHLAERLSHELRHVIVLRGGMGRKELSAVLTRPASIPEHEERLLLATGRYIGEGFDDARLDTLFLALPVSWRGTIAQYVGRLHRLHDRKREVRVYDYTDLDVPMLARMFDRRGVTEVDLLCAEAGLAVELDGAQHLADPDAYRRDRRKDAMLQENGWFVLRFLAEDVGRHLDEILDAPLRTLTRRTQRQS
jgi:superfamily II DNA or RNA helicase